MQNNCNSLHFQSIRSKIEKQTLKRIGHIPRLPDDRPTKIAVLGWLPDLEFIPAMKKKTRTTLDYWQCLIKEAGVNLTEVEGLTKDRKIWRNKIHERMRHLEKWEYFHAIPREGQIFPSSLNRNMKPPDSKLHSSECKCDFKSAADIAIPNKRCHSQTTNDGEGFSLRNVRENTIN